MEPAAAPPGSALLLLTQGNRHSEHVLRGCFDAEPPHWRISTSWAGQDDCEAFVFPKTPQTLSVVSRKRQIIRWILIR